MRYVGYGKVDVDLDVDVDVDVDVDLDLDLLSFDKIMKFVVYYTANFPH